MADYERHVWQAPNVLVVSINRNLGDNRKEIGIVEFPEELDLAKWVHADSPEHQQPDGLLYECVGVASHAGNVEGGHYIAHCRDGTGEGEMHTSL